MIHVHEPFWFRCLIQFSFYFFLDGFIVQKFYDLYLVLYLGYSFFYPCKTVDSDIIEQWGCSYKFLYSGPSC